MKEYKTARKESHHAFNRIKKKSDYKKLNRIQKTQNKVSQDD